MYQVKSKKYFNNPRLDLMSLIPNKENSKVLEVGAGSCETLVEIKRLKPAKEVVGLKLMQLADSQQNNTEIDRLRIGNIESIELDLTEEDFDVIIWSDLLEHLVDPWNALKKLHKHLKSDSVIIVSNPNIREYHNF